MKRLIIPALILSVLFSYECVAQARKYVLIEHFTNASCAPCASHNPIFDSTITKKNIGNIIHVSYHTVWPGVDPMNAYNQQDVADRVLYYSITGVPHIQINGSKWDGMPAGVTQELIDAEASEGSPLRIYISETGDNVTRNVKIVIYTLMEVPQSIYRLRGLVVEKEINYYPPPGSNGETYFPDVYRKSFTTINGTLFTPAEVGDSIVFEYSYNIDAQTWKPENIYSVAFVQDETTKEVINASSTLCSRWGLTNLNQLFQKGSNTDNVFNSKLENFDDVAKDFQISFSSEIPSDWSVEYLSNSQTAAEQLNVTLQPGEKMDFSVKVKSGAKPGLSAHNIKIKDLSDATMSPQNVQYNVIKGVTDLIVNNDGSWGGATSDNLNCKSFEENYINGLIYADNSSFATTWNRNYIRGSRLGLLDEVSCVYYNMGWSFPALSNENIVELAKFLDAGGNLFISGQDLGWEIFDTTTSTYSTPEKKAFYTNYLHSVFLADGTTSNTAIFPNVTDVLFGKIPNGTLANVYGSGTNGPYMYPEEIKATSTGLPIFFYNAFKTKTGAVRSNVPTYKVVYLGFTLEQITNPDIRNQILATSHDWFHGLLSNVDFDKKMNDLSESSFYPNPAHEKIHLKLEKPLNIISLEVLDCLGRKIDFVNNLGNSSEIDIDVNAYLTGKYFAKINTLGQSFVKPFEVIK
jgi:hypothetical protein